MHHLFLALLSFALVTLYQNCGDDVGMKNGKLSSNRDSAPAPRLPDGGGPPPSDTVRTGGYSYPGGETNISCPGGGVHAWVSVAPDDIMDRAIAAAEKVHQANPALVQQACPGRRGSGSNEFLFRVLQELRKDPVDGWRWGLNGKRGDANDMSEDVVDYYWGTGSNPEGQLQTWVIDVIQACEVAEAAPGGTDSTREDVCARWILGPYPYSP